MQQRPEGRGERTNVFFFLRRHSYLVKDVRSVARLTSGSRIAVAVYVSRRGDGPLHPSLRLRPTGLYEIHLARAYRFGVKSGDSPPHRDRASNEIAAALGFHHPPCDE